MVILVGEKGHGMLDCLAETNKFLVGKWFGPPAVVDALDKDQ